MADPTVDDRRTPERPRLEFLPPETCPSLVGGLIKDVWARIEDLWHGRAPLDADERRAIVEQLFPNGTPRRQDPSGGDTRRGDLAPDSGERDPSSGGVDGPHVSESA